MKIPDFDTPYRGAQAIEAYLKQMLRSREKEYTLVLRPGGDFDKTKFHFSDIASKCPRIPIFSVMYRREENRSSHGYYLSGHVHEALICAILDVNHPGEFDFQFKPKNIDPRTQAHFDAIWQPRKVVLELKTTKERIREVGDYPKTEHLMQLGGYVGAVEDDTGEEWQGFLIYIFRDNPVEVDVFPLPSHFKGEMRLRIHETLQNYTDGILPDIPEGFDPSKFPCGWFKDKELVKCPFWDRCWAEVEKEEVQPLQDKELHKMANRLNKLIIEKRDRNGDIPHDMEKEMRQLSEELIPHMERRSSLTVSVDDAECDLKLIKRKDSEVVDWERGQKLGLFKDIDLTPLKVPRAGFSYIKRVKKK